MQITPWNSFWTGPEKCPAHQARRFPKTADNPVKKEDKRSKENSDRKRRITFEFRIAGPKDSSIRGNR